MHPISSPTTPRVTNSLQEEEEVSSFDKVRLLANEFFKTLLLAPLFPLVFFDYLFGTQIFFTAAVVINCMTACKVYIAFSSLFDFDVESHAEVTKSWKREEILEDCLHGGDTFLWIKKEWENREAPIYPKDIQSLLQSNLKKEEKEEIVRIIAKRSNPGLEDKYYLKELFIEACKQQLEETTSFLCRFISDYELPFFLLDYTEYTSELEGAEKMILIILNEMKERGRKSLFYLILPKFLERGYVKALKNLLSLEKRSNFSGDKIIKLFLQNNWTEEKILVELRSFQPFLDLSLLSEFSALSLFDKAMGNKWFTLVKYLLDNDLRVGYGRKRDFVSRFFLQSDWKEEEILVALISLESYLDFSSLSDLLLFEKAVKNTWFKLASYLLEHEIDIGSYGREKIFISSLKQCEKIDLQNLLESAKKHPHFSNTCFRRFYTFQNKLFSWYAYPFLDILKEIIPFFLTLKDEEIEEKVVLPFARPKMKRFRDQLIELFLSQGDKDPDTPMIKFFLTLKSKHRTLYSLTRTPTFFPEFIKEKMRNLHTEVVISPRTNLDKNFLQKVVYQGTKGTKRLQMVKNALQNIYAYIDNITEETVEELFTKPHEQEEKLVAKELVKKLHLFFQQINEKNEEAKQTLEDVKTHMREKTPTFDKLFIFSPLIHLHNNIYIPLMKFYEFSNPQAFSVHQEESQQRTSSLLWVLRTSV